MNHQDERDVCKERGCDCLRFDLPPNYRPFEHVTIPLAGVGRK